jgi:hypothetical protein
LSFQERVTHLPCNSSSTRKQEHLRAGNTKTDPLTSNLQVAQQISKFGAPTLNGGRHSNSKERTLLTPEVKSLMLQQDLITRARTSLFPQETTRWVKDGPSSMLTKTKLLQRKVTTCKM